MIWLKIIFLMEFIYSRSDVMKISIENGYTVLTPNQKAMAPVGEVETTLKTRTDIGDRVFINLGGLKPKKFQGVNWTDFYKGLPEGKTYLFGLPDSVVNDALDPSRSFYGTIKVFNKTNALQIKNCG